MRCLKCGKKTTEKNVFCEECLEVTQKYPVKPGTAIQIPNRDTPGTEKRQPPRHREIAPAELLEQQRRTIRWLLWIVAILSLLLIATSCMLMHLLDKDVQTGTIGNNYTTIESATRP